jgi:hypothetical protein
MWIRCSRTQIAISGADDDGCGTGRRQPGILSEISVFAIGVPIGAVVLNPYWDVPVTAETHVEPEPPVGGNLHVLFSGP